MYAKPPAEKIEVSFTFNSCTLLFPAPVFPVKPLQLKHIAIFGLLLAKTIFSSLTHTNQYPKAPKHGANLPYLQGKVKFFFNFFQFKKTYTLSDTA